MKNIVLVVFGLVLGLFLYDWFLIDKGSMIVTKTESFTDTLFIEVRDTVRITQKEIITEFLRDTVLIDSYKPKISSFKTVQPFLYGNTTVKGEVLGEVLKMDIANDFKIPSVTNTITNTTTIIKKPSGLFLTAGANYNNLTPFVGVTFIKDRTLIGLTTTSVSVGYRIR